METKLNITEILKDKPVNTKLYSPTYGDCNLIVPEDMIITDMLGENRCFYEGGKISKAGECMLFPSKEMRDWSKFAWKKGDVLVSKGRRILHVIFEGFNDDTYTTFKGKHYLCDYSDKEDYDEEYYNDYHKEVNERIIEFEKDNVNNAQTYINIIEKRLGGKLNLETLEIEKQPEFKDGDILYITDRIVSCNFIMIYKNQEGDRIYHYATLPENNLVIMTKGGFLSDNGGLSKHYATEEKKQQLFDALAKEGKAWDAEKKQIVDLKPKVRFKPFDRIVTYGEITHEWSCDIFSHYAKNYEGKEVITCLGGVTYYKALPYNEETAKLLGTTKDVEG